MKQSNNKKRNNRNTTNNSKSNGSYRGKKYDGKSSVKGDNNCASTAPSSLNAVEWYTKFPELLANASRVAFPYKPGMRVGEMKVRFKSDPTGSSPVYDFYEPYGIGGVCGIHWIPSIGPSTGSDTQGDPGSGINVAARELWLKVRAAYSGALDLDPPDLIMGVIAIDNIHAAIAAAKRLYKTFRIYTGENLDYPKRVIDTLAYNSPGDTSLEYLTMEADRYLQRINIAIRRAAKYNIPVNGMSVFDRHRWLNENIYLDNPTVNSQSYVFVQDVYYKWGRDDTNKTMLMETNPSDYNTGTKSIAEGLILMIESMLDALDTDEDAQILNGYLTRAFAGEQKYTVPLLGAEEILVPAFQTEVLTQIHNAIPNGEHLGKTCHIRQDVNTNTIYWNPQFTGIEYDNTGNSEFMDLGVDTSPISVVIASRLMGDAGTNSKGVAYSGTEIVTQIFYMSKEIQSFARIRPVPITIPESQDALRDVYHTAENMLDAVTLVSQFAGHPRLYIGAAQQPAPAAGPVSLKLGMMWDVHNPTTVTKELLQRISDVCIYSEYNCFNIQ